MKRRATTALEHIHDTDERKSSQKAEVQAVNLVVNFDGRQKWPGVRSYTHSTDVTNGLAEWSKGRREHYSNSLTRKFWEKGKFSKGRF
jgi:hypothetical protein